ncbi:MAG: HAMP domain-containing sensor histidine kinase [Lachnospiraceae bacterium]
MRSTLHIKFIIIYLIFGFLSFFTVATLTSGLTMSRLENDASGSLYKEANLVANNYLRNYFTNMISPGNIQVQLNGMSTYLHASVWFVDKEGTLIATGKSEDSVAAPPTLEHFDPLESGNKQYQVGTYHDLFEEDVMTVIAPVTQGFLTRGYLLIHKPLSDLTEIRDSLLDAVYITITVIYILSFMILLGFQFFIFRPLRKITEAAALYASGDLDYEIPVNTQDEMGYLSASLNYMSSQLKDLEDYQKKFIANVSHDFRSPLTSIKGYIEAITDGTIPTEMQDKYLKIILFETARLTDLTKDLLALNEFDTKDLLLDKTSFDLHEMIKNTASSFEGTCTGKRIGIELLFAAKTLPVYADSRKIQQVLYNLLDNSIKFSNADSTITIETTDRGEKVYVSIKDYGIGIPRDGLNKIWERFYKTDLSRGKDKKGTGLGLSIVKEIIQAHGENINVISTEGVGTEFIFSLIKSP